MKKAIMISLSFIIWLMLISGCGQMEENGISEPMQSDTATALIELFPSEMPDTDVEQEELSEEVSIPIQEPTPSDELPFTEQSINIDEIPAYSGTAYAVINNNIPYFTDSELSAVSYEYYSELDSLGRCGVCVASIGQDIMPAEERGEIGNIKPTGWHTVKYPGIIDGNYLYNRCHLIGYQLAGENKNVNNLITGTRYMNVEGMLPFENEVADYVQKTGNHVMYRVTPMFQGNNLLADGVLIEAESVEDNGSGILFNVFCYNVQPGITIDYATGDSVEDASIAAEGTSTQESQPEPASEATPTIAPEETATITPTEAPAEQVTIGTSASSGAYAVNSKNGKIHITGKCSATGNGSNAMKVPVYFDTYEEAEAFSIRIAPSQDKRQCGNCW